MDILTTKICLLPNWRIMRITCTRNGTTGSIIWHYQIDQETNIGSRNSPKKNSPKTPKNDNPNFLSEIRNSQDCPQCSLIWDLPPPWSPPAFFGCRICGTNIGETERLTCNECREFSNHEPLRHVSGIALGKPLFLVLKYEYWIRIYLFSG